MGALVRTLLLTLVFTRSTECPTSSMLYSRLAFSSRPLSRVRLLELLLLLLLLLVRVCLLTRLDRIHDLYSSWSTVCFVQPSTSISQIDWRKLTVQPTNLSRRPSPLPTLSYRPFTPISLWLSFSNGNVRLMDQWRATLTGAIRLLVSVITKHATKQEG